MQVKCMALDMDGTLLWKGTLSETNRKAVDRAVKAGVQIVIASGRSYDSLPQDILHLPGVTYAITSNGAGIYRVSDGKCLHGWYLSRTAVEKILPLTEDPTIACEAFVEGKAYAEQAYIEEPSQYGVAVDRVSYIQETRTPVRQIKAFLVDHIEQLESIDLVVKDPQKKQVLWEQVTKEAPDVYLTSSNQPLIEISAQGTGKHQGLAYLADLMHWERSQIAAFGNADNDCEMLRFAGVGVAVQDASPNCLKAADMIVGNCQEDGVAQGIDQLLS